LLRVLTDLQAYRDGLNDVLQVLDYIKQFFKAIDVLGLVALDSWRRGER
jgi:hypothetical protein